MLSDAVPPPVVEKGEAGSEKMSEGKSSELAGSPNASTITTELVGGAGVGWGQTGIVCSGGAAHPTNVAENNCPSDNGTEPVRGTPVTDNVAVVWMDPLG